MIKMAREISKQACERKIERIKGYVIGRKLIDLDEKEKPFTYYPRKKCGKPPYLFKTKSEAMKTFKKMKKKGEFPADQSNAIVVKFNKKIYLDRY